MKKIRLILLVCCLILVVQSLSFILKNPLIPEAYADSGNWQVSASADDSLRRKVPDYWSTATVWLDAGLYNASWYEYGSGFKFTNVGIPQGSTITNAVIDFTCRSAGDASGFKSKISGDDVDNAAAFSTSADFDTRFSSHTTAIVTYDYGNQWLTEFSYNSSDFSSVIQEIVSRSGWSSGNAIALFWEDFENRSPAMAEPYSYDGSSTKAPKLYVTWTHAPLIDSVGATDVLGNYWLCKYSTSFTVEVKVTDSNGVADLTYVELNLECPSEGTYGATIRWTENTNAFAITAGSAYISLGSSTKSTSGNQVILDYKFYPDWDYGLTSSIDCTVYAIDDSGNSVGPTLNTINVQLANTITTTPSASTYRVSTSGSVTISGYLTYVGPASTYYLPNADISANGVIIHNSAHASQGTGSTYNYAIAITAPSTIGNFSYHVYVDGVGDFSDGDKGGSTSSVNTDRIRIDTLSRTDADGRVDVGTVGTYYTTASLEYASHPLGAGDSLSLGARTFIWDPVDSRFECNLTLASVTSVTISNFTSGNEVTYGITSGNINGKTVTLIWDRIEIYMKDDPEISLASVECKFEKDHFVPFIDIHISEHSAGVVVNLKSLKVTFINVEYMDGSVLDLGLSETIDINKRLVGDQHVLYESRLETGFLKQPHSLFVKFDLTVPGSTKDRVITQTMKVDMPVATVPSSTPQTHGDIDWRGFIAPLVLVGGGVCCYVFWPRKNREKHCVKSDETKP